MVCPGKLQRLALLTLPMTSSASAYPLLPEGNANHNIRRYIVTLRNGLDPSVVEDHMQWAANAHFRSNSHMVKMGRRWNIGSWNAYSCTLDDGTLAQINSDDAVELVEVNSPVFPMKHDRQENAPWGLADISHRAMNHTDYIYDSRAGEGTYAYILDTGLLTTHEEFEGRASLGYNAVGGQFVDEIGHGTHIAGTIAGKTFGVARKAKLVSVKIFTDYKAYTSDLLEGLHWAVHNITRGQRQEVSVINISAGGEVRESVNRAVEEAYKQGVLSVVAAGNYDVDARGISPASAPNAITVGSIGRSRSRSGFSDWGELVDIFAPGEGIMSAWIRSNKDTRTLDGTSMATPHISGLVLYLKSLIPYRMRTPADSVNELRRLSTNGVVGDARGSKNLLGFNGNGVVILTGD